MKLTTFALLALAPTLSLASAAYDSDRVVLHKRAFGNFGNGGKGGFNRGGGGRGGGGQQQGQGKTSSKQTAAASTTQAVAATSSSSTAAAATQSNNAANNNNNNGGDPQSSLTLDSSQVQTGLKLDGQQTPAADQVASATSSNNFINFCLTRSDLPLTNGAQVKTGSCNPTPMGVIIAQSIMPSCKFISPKNLDTIAANQDFTISMAIKNMKTGNFVNAAANYFAAPQNTDSSGTVIGHSHVVVEAIDSLTSTTVTNPQSFAFFKGLNAAAVNGVLTATVTGGLPAGTYRIASINSASNHQPVLVAVAQTVG